MTGPARRAVARELVTAVGRLAGRTPVPRVRALHLPPASADRTRAGEFCALELEGGTVGLAFVLLGDTIERLRAGPGAAAVAGAEPLALARGFADGEGVDRILGFAAVNALSALIFERAGWIPGAATDTIGHLAPGPGDEVGMVGLFPPLVDRIVRTGARLTVVELRPDLAGPRDGYRVTLDPEALRACRKVLSTSTVLLNDTLDELLARCAGASAFALVGPGAGCLPDPLFARGVTLVGGTWVVDRPALLEAIRTGAPWGNAARKSAVTRAEYPGVDALLDRIGPG
jgi:uncharacterized protein (DUF4213/DUF364 family)